MKVGIVTYHRSHNYGALLQAIAFRFVLESMGHSVYFVDYWPDYHKRMYKLFNWKRLFNWRKPLASIKYFFYSVFSIGSSKRRIKNSEKFISHYIEPYCSKDNEEFDVIFYGSDQIWRKQNELNNYNPIYFGDNNFVAKKHISYAASMGVLPDSNDREYLLDLLSHLDSISVRESDLCSYLMDLGLSNISECLDPTLLLNVSNWNDLIPNVSVINKPYILLYDIQNDVFDNDELKKFVSDKNLQLITLHAYPLVSETNSDICSHSVDSFVNLIRNAEFVFSTSFHGLVFSIINHKEFCVSYKRRSSRAVSLLNNCGIEGRIISPGSKLPRCFEPINYDDVDIRISKFVDNSISFIKKSLTL